MTSGAYSLTTKTPLFKNIIHRLFDKETDTPDMNDLYFFRTYLKKNKDDVSVLPVTYKIINYKRDKIDATNIQSLGVLRSLVFNSKNELVCFSPVKSFNSPYMSEGVTTSQTTGDKQHIVEEFIDGTMINMFWCKESSSWQIMTKKNIGAENSYYVYSTSNKQKKFKDMFWETFHSCVPNADHFSQFSKNIVYSFVLVHPENRIITKVSEPKVYLVEAYKIESFIDEANDYENTKYTVHILSRSEKQYMIDGTSCLLPEEFDVPTTMGSLFKSQNRSDVKKGFVLKSYSTETDETAGSGSMYLQWRSKFVNKDYLAIQKLKNNCSDIRFMYLSLRKTKKITEYLRVFPEQAPIFDEYCSKVHDYTHLLYEKYCECFIVKSNPLNTYDASVRTHMFTLHQMYIKEFKEHNKKLRFSDIIEYVNNMDIPLLFTTIFKSSTAYNSVSDKPDSSENTSQEQVIEC